MRNEWRIAFIVSVNHNLKCFSPVLVSEKSLYFSLGLPKLLVWGNNCNSKQHIWNYSSVNLASIWGWGRISRLQSTMPLRGWSLHPSKVEQLRILCRAGRRAASGGITNIVSNCYQLHRLWRSCVQRNLVVSPENCAIMHKVANLPVWLVLGHWLADRFVGQWCGLALVIGQLGQCTTTNIFLHAL